jgi:hypothetical protein
LAVGSGFVVEPINNAIAVFDRMGHLLGFEALSAFFGLPPTFLVKNGQVAPPFGPFLSDPRAYFDSTNGHFIVTELQIGVDPTTGNLGATSNVLIAVSATNNPLGSWNVFSLDISQDGDARLWLPYGLFGDQASSARMLTALRLHSMPSRCLQTIRARNFRHFLWLR